MVIQGLIRPPPEIRAVADKTALFIAKRGRAYETRIVNSDKGRTDKFAFLQASSPFHAYYEDRVRFYEAGGEEEEKQKEKEEEEVQREASEKAAADNAAAEEAAREGEARRKKEAARKKASAVDPIARALLVQRAKISAARRERQRAEAEAEAEAATLEGRGGEGGSGSAAAKARTKSTSSSAGPAPPPSLRFTSMSAPSALSLSEIETIKLVAQYAALAGKKSSFLKDLTRREWTNPLFEFLQPRNPSFAYFTALVDVYRFILGDGLLRLEERERADLESKGSALVTAEVKERYAVQDSATAKEAHASDPVALCSAHNGIDAALDIAAYRAEYDRDAAERRRAELEAAGGGGVGLGGWAAIDWHDFVVVETIDFARDEVVEAVPPPPSGLLKDWKQSKNGDKDMKRDDAVQAPTVGKDMEESDGDMEVDAAEGSDDEHINVVPSYQSKVVSTAALTADKSKTHVIDPITGKSIPVSDLSEHMRIQLMDPKWQEERKKFIDKQRDSNIVGGDDIASNIASFAKERGDLFGSSEQELLNQEADSRKRLEKANRIIREQAQPGPSLPPPPSRSAPASNPPPPPPVAPRQRSAATRPKPSAEGLPVAKRARIDERPSSQSARLPSPNLPAAAAVPPPPPPPAPLEGVPPPAPLATGKAIIPAKEFIASLPNAQKVSVTVMVPNDPTNLAWNFDGRAVSLTVDITSATVKNLKEILHPHLGDMPVNKIQLRNASTFLKDKDGLAQLNITSGTTLELVPKIRRRK